MPAHDRREQRVVQVRDEHADAVRPAGPQAAGHRVRAVPERGRGAEHPLGRVLADQRAGSPGSAPGTRSRGAHAPARRRPASVTGGSATRQPPASARARALRARPVDRAPAPACSGASRYRRDGDRQTAMVSTNADDCLPPRHGDTTALPRGRVSGPVPGPAPRVTMWPCGSASLPSPTCSAGPSAHPRQLIRVTLAGDDGGPPRPGPAGEPVTVRVDGPGVARRARCGGLEPGAGRTRPPRCPVDIAAPPRRAPRPRHRDRRGRAAGGRAERAAGITVAEPGWTMWMVSHFHYDPVWWNTQAPVHRDPAAAAGRGRHGCPSAGPPSSWSGCTWTWPGGTRTTSSCWPRSTTSSRTFDTHPEDAGGCCARLIAERPGRDRRRQLQRAEHQPDLRGVDHPQRGLRPRLPARRARRRPARPPGCWTRSASTRRYPGLMAAAGLAESAWARGPFHQWGPNGTVGGQHADAVRQRVRVDVAGRQRPAHRLHAATTTGRLGHPARGRSLAAARAGRLRAVPRCSAPVAATRNVLLPVGADHVIPSRWATRIHRDWNARYVWPRFVTAVPREFFAAVRAGTPAARRRGSPRRPGT